MLKLLVIEDEAETAAYIEQGFKQSGHSVDIAIDGLDGLMMAKDGQYDVIIIDRGLPQLDGLTLLQTLRKTSLLTPVLFLTALGSIEDKLQGFTAGGDDYLVKPFAFSELSARVHSLARRPQVMQEHTQLSAGDLTLFLTKRQVIRAGNRIELQPTEFRLLEFLLLQKSKIVTRTMLLEKIWDFHFDPKTSVVETHISRLRAKIDKPYPSHLIKTVRGAGYIIDEP